MRLFLLRHADAEMPAPTDDARPLSPQGHEEAKTVARFCVRHDVRPKVLLCSPLRRARETAQPVAEATGAELLVVPWLASGMAPHDGVEQLTAYKGTGDVMMVGHEPDFSQLAALLLGLPSNSTLQIRKASLTALELFSIRAGGARLDWTLPCRLM